MRPEVKRDLSDSAADFERVVWPEARKWCRGVAYEPIERRHGRAFRWLDIHAGIDGLILTKDGRVRSLASRLQWGHAYGSFTVRLERPNGINTEMHKRQDGPIGMRPELTLQAYISERGGAGVLWYAAMAQTDDLYTLIDQRPDMVETRTNPQDGVTFAVVWHRDLQACGVRVLSYTRPRIEVRHRRVKVGSA